MSEQSSSNERCNHTKVFITDSTMFRMQVPCPWCKDSEISSLRGQLDACEQHVKILQEQRAAHEPKPQASNELVDRLRNEQRNQEARGGDEDSCERWNLAKDAADEIERLRADLEHREKYWDQFEHIPKGAHEPDDGPLGLVHQLEVLRQRWSHNVAYEALIGSCKDAIEQSLKRPAQRVRCTLRQDNGEGQ